MGPEFFPLPQSFDLAQTLELDSHLHGRNSPAFLKEISMRITLMEWKRTSWATKTQAHIHFIAARENQELSLLVTANFQYLRPFEENTTAHEVAFAENFQPESDQASGFHYTLPGERNMLHHSWGRCRQNSACGTRYRRNRLGSHRNKLQSKGKEVERNL